MVRHRVRWVRDLVFHLINVRVSRQGTDTSLCNGTVPRGSTSSLHVTTVISSLRFSAGNWPRPRGGKGDALQGDVVVQLCPTLCDPMDCGTPGFPVLHHLLEFAQTRPLSRWCHPTISSSVIPFFSCLQSFPTSGTFPTSQLFPSGGKSLGASAWLGTEATEMLDIAHEAGRRVQEPHSTCPSVLCTGSHPQSRWQRNDPFF